MQGPDRYPHWVSQKKYPAALAAGGGNSFACPALHYCGEHDAENLPCPLWLGSEGRGQKRLDRQSLVAAVDMDLTAHNARQGGNRRLKCESVPSQASQRPRSPRTPYHSIQVHETLSKSKSKSSSRVAGRLRVPPLWAERTSKRVPGHSQVPSLGPNGPSLSTSTSCSA